MNKALLKELFNSPVSVSYKSPGYAHFTIGNYKFMFELDIDSDGAFNISFGLPQDYGVSIDFDKMVNLTTKESLQLWSTIKEILIHLVDESSPTIIKFEAFGMVGGLESLYKKFLPMIGKELGYEYEYIDSELVFVLTKDIYLDKWNENKMLKEILDIDPSLFVNQYVFKRGPDAEI